MKLFKIVLFVLITIVSAGEVIACLCMNIDTVCDAYENAEAVIVGKLTEVRSYTNDNVSDDYKIGQLATFSITSTYKGDLKNSVEIWQVGSSCMAEIKDVDVGKTFLLYLHKANDNKRFSIIVCGRSRQLKGGEGDISWLDNLPSSLKRSFLYGSIMEYEYDEDNDPRYKSRIPNAKLELIGNKRSFSSTTNENGYFEFWDLPNETYRFSVDAGNSFRFENSFIKGFWDIDPEEEKNFDPLKDQKFEVDGEGCAEVEYDLMKGEKKKDQ